MDPTSWYVLLYMLLFSNLLTGVSNLGPAQYFAALPMGSFKAPIDSPDAELAGLNVGAYMTHTYRTL